MNTTISNKRILEEGEDECVDTTKRVFLEEMQRPLTEHVPIKGENLSCDYYPNFFNLLDTTELFRKCEESIEYLTGDNATVRLYGKSCAIPRKHVGYGNTGIIYTFSGTHIHAKPWLPFLESVRKAVSNVVKAEYNFVMINRYEGGKDYIGEHRDDEKELDPLVPIASLSLGEERDFILKHKDTRGKAKTRTDVTPLKIKLGNGSLLLMKSPTNKFWYHTIPKRAKAKGVRINMTFRRIVRQFGEW